MRPNAIRTRLPGSGTDAAVGTTGGGPGQEYSGGFTPAALIPAQPPAISGVSTPPLSLNAGPSPVPGNPRSTSSPVCYQCAVRCRRSS